MAVVKKQRLRIPPRAGIRLPIGQHPVYRDRWIILKSKLSAVKGVTDDKLDGTTDLLFTVQLGHEAALRATRAGDPAFTSAEVDETAEVLKKAANRKRVIAKRLREAQKARRRKRAAELNAQLAEAHKLHFIAGGIHRAAMGRFNAAWTELDDPSMRLRTTEERRPIASTARRLAGEFGYSEMTICALLVEAGFLTGSAKAPHGEKSQALDTLLRILAPQHLRDAVERLVGPSPELQLARN